MIRAAGSCVVLLIASAFSRSSAAPPSIPLPDEPRVRAAFARFAALQGDWIGKSTKGWTDRVTVRTIAAGSAVLQTSFDAHPGETMATVIHLDGARLLLTHYCVAKNQPRLVATGIADDARTVTFEFLDGTNMASRSVGHMDRVVYRFVDADTYRSRWTWSENGKDDWMEEIESKRVKPADGSPGL